MVNKSKWIYNYNSLDPNNQLEVAEAIMEELHANEETFDEEEYNHVLSKIVRLIILMVATEGVEPTTYRV